MTGQWLVCHASCLRDAEGNLGDIALVIEPAKAAEIAPIIVQAYDLTRREQEITQLIAKGAATAEIAGRLYLSAHTVRDYIKTIFEKVGVSSRGELWPGSSRNTTRPCTSTPPTTTSSYTAEHRSRRPSRWRRITAFPLARW